MAVVMTILLWLLGIVGAVLLLVLLMPIGLRAQGAVALWHATGSIEGRWAFGLLGVRLSRESGAQLRVLGLGVATLSTDAEKRKARRETKRAKKAEKKRQQSRGVRWGWRNRLLFYRLVRALHLRGTLRGTIGLGDPADTAQLAILVRPVTERVPGFETRLVWDYVDEALFLDAGLRARVWPAELAFILLTSLLRGGSRRALLAKH